MLGWLWSSKKKNIVVSTDDDAVEAQRKKEQAFKENSLKLEQFLAKGVDQLEDILHGASFTIPSTKITLNPSVRKLY
ncbi:MAG: hypothetical protein ACHP9Y_06380, partial [Gammaproteobacteria bacterium]